MTRPSGPIVLVSREVPCDDCHRDALVTTDGLSAYTESADREYVGGSRSGTVVSTLCPAPARYGDGEPCHGTLLVDLGEREAWTAATTELVARLSLAGRLDV